MYSVWQKQIAPLRTLLKFPALLMKKIQAILAVLLIGAFSVLLVKNGFKIQRVLEQPNETREVSEVSIKNQNESNTKSSIINTAQQTQSSRVPLDHFSSLCTKLPSELAQVTWYQSFQKAEGKYITSDAQGFQEVVELCWNQKDGHVIFMLENRSAGDTAQVPAQQIGYWKNGDTSVTMLPVSQPAGDKNAAQRYELRGWINTDFFLIATVATNFPESVIIYEMVDKKTGGTTFLKSCEMKNNQEVC
ncbi:MAG: hypothetical protein A3B74_02610 [Candidatus Kerfeldbacteria bacterium RIFCSPHIGHO2_02_FULL_42_14]|uniref:Uncharacterized protein n=1 Tax=Candidatus Kerfeldbacteria bacterium RIFCSPHIGHO2_02_FULL_42_14 TaxID=1798540 RepID=A0A1G2AUE2_9BACT|nr:MAG: hypothetical protein A3B74_02610 [Candidatus Kerfeldbacteria bacterium RIFCSPHIGHO2_02_FULL_42_14]OGY80432.1 MAG: hypothetical protein A3E60_05230 [Candidatus Kerfeldbacteria bacterium RIFCSPHIGHO2_12_FULL_42_13]OGY83862.1 MAG: hypothetical protein A3I91_04755 [Candidatus Kerfeldbacteria bacterium RIFCSPLOWO2_02_FULL_42_19]OGY86599.1 MAG: hypothetical protein A3G01_05075 [Candidatus Kerfeldbacteria bacterium RIFCSPLOWO2_12_FULL_43_9]